jgi:hypothetical protein
MDYLSMRVCLVIIQQARWWIIVGNVIGSFHALCILNTSKFQKRLIVLQPLQKITFCVTIKFSNLSNNSQKPLPLLSHPLIISACIIEMYYQPDLVLIMHGMFAAGRDAINNQHKCHRRHGIFKRN